MPEGVGNKRIKEAGSRGLLDRLKREPRISFDSATCILNDVPQLDEYPDRVNRISDLRTLIKDATHGVSLPAY